MMMFYLLAILLSHYLSQNIKYTIPVSFTAPNKPGDKETHGLVADIKVYDQILKQFISTKMMIDTLSSSFWLMSLECGSDPCINQARSSHLNTPNKLYGEANLYLNNGALSANIIFTSVNLTSIMVNNQSIFLIKETNMTELKERNINGVLGLSKYLSILHTKTSYRSIIQNIENFKEIFIIFKLADPEPYIKFGYLDYFDMDNIRKDKAGKSESLGWINMIEGGSFILPLRHIVLIYRDKINKIINSEIVFDDCLKNGCRAEIDTKTYFTYGPRAQISKLLFKKPDCMDINDLPDIEFSFYDITDKKSSESSLTLDMVIEPSDYMFNDEEGYCASGFGENGEESGWTLGIMFIKKFLMIYDVGKERIGFVRVKESNILE